jgi:hypothetical protein
VPAHSALSTCALHWPFPPGISRASGVKVDLVIAEERLHCAGMMLTTTRSFLDTGGATYIDVFAESRTASAVLLFRTSNLVIAIC